MTHNPDTPGLHEAMNGENRDDFLVFMGKKIAELEQQNTWKVVNRTSLPRGANLLPSTWDLKIKIYPHGRMWKHKSRYCVKGDGQINNLDYFESCAPFVSMSTIWVVINIDNQRVWSTEQVDFYNAFVQATLEEEVYVEMRDMFSEKYQQWSNGCSKVNQVTLCNCSVKLYLVPTSTERSQDSRIWAIWLGQGNSLWTRDYSYHLSWWLLVLWTKYQGDSQGD